MKDTIIAEIDTEHVSFDVFDTLVRRCCAESSDVFDYVARRASASGLPTASLFPAARRMAEQEAISIFGSEGLRIDQIYDLLRNVFSAEEINVYRSYEEEAEVDVCVPCSELVLLYNELLSSHKLCIISDMYLPREVIASILKKCGIHGYSKLFVSGEEGANKDSGRLFLKVLEEMGLSSSDLTHIGNSDFGDYFIPKSLGIKAVYVKDGRLSRAPKSPITSKVQKKLSALKPRQKIAPTCLSDVHFDYPHRSNERSESQAYQTGFSVFGPFLFSFSMWLADMKEQRKLDEMLFLSRDGYIMQKAYDMLYPEHRTKYLFGSRRALVVPTLWVEPGYDDMVSALGFAGLTSVREFVERMGIDANAISDELDSLNISQDDTFDLKDDTCRVLRELYSLIQPHVVANSKEEFETFRAYLGTTIESNKRYGLVDIGWRGSMQRGLSRMLSLCEISAGIIGLYTGVFPAFNWKSECEMHGFLFESNSDLGRADREQCFNNVYESLFFAPHGSVSHFAWNSGGAVGPVLQEYEYDEASHAVFSELHQGALDYIGVVKECNMLRYCEYDRDYAWALVERLGLNPTVGEATLLGDCVTDYQGTPEYLAMAQPLSHYALHPRDFRADIKKCWWKPGFLKRSLGGPFNYGELFYRVKNAVHGAGFDDWGNHLSEEGMMQARSEGGDEGSVRSR